MAISSFQAITLSTDITLAWQSPFTPAPYLLDINYFTPINNNDHNVILPDATQGTVGFNCEISNRSDTHKFSILMHDDNVLYPDIPVGTNMRLILTDNTTIAGTWVIQPFIGNMDPITSISAISSDGSLITVVTPDSPLLPPGGTIDTKLQPSLANLQQMQEENDPGIVILTGANPATWITQSLQAGNGISIGNPSGVAGPPNIALADVIDNVTTLTAGGITLNGNTISPQAGSNLILQTTAPGGINLNGAGIDIEGNLFGKSLILSGNIVSPFAPKGFISFNDTGQSIIVTNTAGFDTPVKSPDTVGRYRIPFLLNREDTNYTVLISAGTQSNIDQPPITLGFLVAGSETISGFDIIVTNESRELVTAIPNGLTILLMAMV